MAPGRLKHRQQAQPTSSSTQSSSPSSDESLFSSDLGSDSDDPQPPTPARAGGKKTISTKTRPSKRIPIPPSTDSSSELSEVDIDSDSSNASPSLEEEDIGVIIPRGGKGRSVGLGKGGGLGKSRPTGGKISSKSRPGSKSLPPFSTKSTRKRKSPTPPTPTSDHEQLYCICRTGHDGEEFMVACDGCEEWFHGRCVGVTPAIALEREYFCERCKGGKSTDGSDSDFGVGDVPLSVVRKGGKGGKIGGGGVGGAGGKRVASKGVKSRKSAPPQQPPTTTPDSDSDLLEDGICIVCDGECTCNISITALSTPIPIPSPPVQSLTPSSPLDPTPPKKKAGKAAKAKAEKKAGRKGKEEGKKVKEKEKRGGKVKSSPREKEKAIVSSLTQDWHVSPKHEPAVTTPSPTTPSPTQNLYAFIIETSSSDDDIFASEDEMEEFKDGLDLVGVGVGVAEASEEEEELKGSEGFGDGGVVRVFTVAENDEDNDGEEGDLLDDTMGDGGYGSDEDEDDDEEGGWEEYEIEINPERGWGVGWSSSEEEDEEDLEEFFMNSSPVMKGINGGGEGETGESEGGVGES
ncbi:hypothetical protein HDV00_012144, partial [Rhizophlyctis rosea]